MGRSKKPCPGCGEENTGRDANAVCHPCKVLLGEALAARERAKQETETGVFRLAYHYYSLPYIDHCEREPVQKAFQEMLYAVGQPVLGGAMSYDTPALIEKSDTAHSLDWARRVPLAFRESANQLYKEIKNATEAAYQEGYRDGQNLIVQLARGEVSLNEYREESGERSHRRR